MGREKLWAIREHLTSVEGNEDAFGNQAIGTCMDMCPAQERETRERLRDLSTFEQLPDDPRRTSRELAVKKFCRTQRGMDPTLVRPLPVLRMTMARLLRILGAQGQSLAAKYPFLCDRFRAVRQDMVMQGISGQDAVELLLPMIRFHIAAAYCLAASKASTTPRPQLDPQASESKMHRRSGPTGSTSAAAAAQPSARLSESKIHRRSQAAGSTRAAAGAHPSARLSDARQTGGPAPSASFDAHLNFSFLSQCILSALQSFNSTAPSPTSRWRGCSKAGGREEDPSATAPSDTPELPRCLSRAEQSQVCGDRGDAVGKSPRGSNAGGVNAPWEASGGNPCCTRTDDPPGSSAILPPENGGPPSSSDSLLRAGSPGSGHQWGEHQRCSRQSLCRQCPNAGGGVCLQSEGQVQRGQTRGKGTEGVAEAQEQAREQKQAQAEAETLTEAEAEAEAEALTEAEAEAEVWMYYVLLNMGPCPGMQSVDSLAVVFSAVPRHVLSGSVIFRTAFEAVRCYNTGNFVRYFRLMKAVKDSCRSLATTSFQLCLLQLHAPEVLREGLLSIHASGISQYPVPLLEIKRLTSIDEEILVAACSHLSLTVTDQGSAGLSIIPKAPRTLPTEAVSISTGILCYEVEEEELVKQVPMMFDSLHH